VLAEPGQNAAEWDPWPAEWETREADSFEPPQSFEQETIDLLRAEVGHLQLELAWREQQLADARSLSERPVAQGEAAVSDPDETAQLVARMETLLDELDQSDERVAQLERLLQHSEEAAEAERQERRHLEHWVGDIERRVGQREAEWHAEREVLQQQLGAATEQQQRLDLQLQRRPSNNNGLPSQADEVRQLRQQNAHLQQQLAQLQKEYEQRVEQQSGANHHAQAGPSTIPTAADLREEHVRLAQERALLARQQAEFAALRTEFERLTQSQRRPDEEGDTKLRALRDHLREIHLQEQQVQSERSLGSRLAQLWRRLEGRTS
jgi:chromosome segregation ATPase